MKKNVFIALLSIVVLGFTCEAPAASFKAKKKPVVHHDTVIASVSESSITVMEDKTRRTYTITASTEIDFKGQRSTIGALKPGMAVDVTAGADATVASRVNAQDPPVHYVPNK